MASIRDFIETQLLDPLKQYPTKIQDTIIELIIEKIETLYNYTIQFPEIISPNKNRLDIIQAITDQFLFTIRDEADLDEQINILDHILYVYSKRGSIDTIENMWKYYGGDLPKEVKVIIPSYDLFRYSVSKLSGTHVFPNDPDVTGIGDYYRPGIYNIRLTNSTYPIADLKKFLLSELVAAGNLIVFTNSIYMEILSENTESNPYKYEMLSDSLDTLVMLQLEVMKEYSGLNLDGKSSYSRDIKIGDETYQIYKGNVLSGSTEESYLSGNLVIQFWLTISKELNLINLAYNTYEIEITYNRSDSEVNYSISVLQRQENHLDYLLYCTPEINYSYVYCRLYDKATGERIGPSNYPGYFILGETLLDGEVI